MDYRKSWNDKRFFQSILYNTIEVISQKRLVIAFVPQKKLRICLTNLEEELYEINSQSMLKGRITRIKVNLIKGKINIFKIN